MSKNGITRITGRIEIDNIISPQIDNINEKNNEQDEKLSNIESELPNKANISHTHTVSDVTDIKTLSTKALFDRMYPTGSIYMSFTKQPPPFGQWELLEEGYFLQSTTTTSGEKGGTATHTHSTANHTLTIDEIPAHYHDLKGYGATLGSGSTGWRFGGGGTKLASDVVTNTGGGKAHNHGNTGSSSNIPPYIKCYMYKRIDDTSTTTEIPDEINAINDATIDLTEYVKRGELADYAKITTDEVNHLKQIDIGKSYIIASNDETNPEMAIGYKVEGEDHHVLCIDITKDENNNIKHSLFLIGKIDTVGGLDILGDMHILGDIYINKEPLSSKFAAITTDESGWKNLNIGDVFIKNIKDDTGNDIAIGIKKTDGDVVLFNSDTSGTNKTIYVYDDLNVFNNLHVNGTITSLKPVTLSDSLTAPTITSTDLTATNINATSITAATFNGLPILKENNKPSICPYIPVVQSDGVMEVGRMIDFHAHVAAGEMSGTDHDCRLWWNNGKLSCDQTFTAPNINATSITTNTINGMPFNMDGTTTKLPQIAVIQQNGSMEVGRMIDFHTYVTNGTDGELSSTNYDCRFWWNHGGNDKLECTKPFIAPNISASFTVTHETGANEELIVGTFCESDGTIYEKYKDDIKPDDCICNIKQSTSLNKNIIGVTISTDPIKFATHGDVLIKVVNDTYNVGDILVPGQGGYGKKPTGDELMTCLLNKIPTAKITSLETGIDNEVACIML